MTNHEKDCVTYLYIYKHTHTHKRDVFFWWLNIFRNKPSLPPTTLESSFLPKLLPLWNILQWCLSVRGSIRLSLTFDSSFPCTYSCFRYEMSWWCVCLSVGQSVCLWRLTHHFPVRTYFHSEMSCSGVCLSLGQSICLWRLNHSFPVRSCFHSEMSWWCVCLSGGKSVCVWRLTYNSPPFCVYLSVCYLIR